MHATRVTWLALATAVLLFSLGCSSPSGPASHIFPLGGTWSGTGSDTYQPHLTGATPPRRASQVTLNITQNGTTLSGTWSITYADPANNGSGTLTGTASAQEWNCKEYTGSAHFWDCDEYRTLVDLTLTSTKTGFPTLYMHGIYIYESERNTMRNIRYQNTFELNTWVSMVGDVTLAKQ